jgi:acyl-CoA synthetase (AMP-forming)/AMP-acid ligase II
MIKTAHDPKISYANFAESLQRHALTIPDQLAYRFLQDGRDNEVTITFAQLDIAVRAAAATLQLYCAPGDRVLILLKPGLDYVIGFLGCLYAGLIAVPAYPPGATKTLDRLDGILGDCCPAAALTTREDIAAIRARLAEVAPATQVLDLSELDHATATNWQPVPVTRADVAFLQYTSGSTGNPKGVIVTHGNLLHNSQSIHENFSTHTNSHNVSWLPPYHDMGLIGGILQSVYIGFPSTLIAPIHFLQRPLRWLQAISKHRGTISGGPNFAYELCLKKIKEEELAGLDLSSWEVAFNGAEHVRAQTIEAFHSKFSRCGFKTSSVFPCYGLAEGTLLVTCDRAARDPVIRHFHAALLEDNRAEPVPSAFVAEAPELRVRTLVSSGRGIPGHEPFIGDPETEERLADGRVGEICVVGDSVANGYWQRPESTAAAFRPARQEQTAHGSFFRSGDLGFLLDGELYVTGRLKDLIILNGVNHHPGDIESTVFRVDESFRPDGSAAFSVELDDSEQLVIAQEVERRALKHLDVPRILAEIKADLWQQHRVAQPVILLVFGGTLPRTSSGKVRRQECRRLFEPFISELHEGLQADAEGVSKKVVAAELGGQVVLDISRNNQILEV